MEEKEPLNFPKHMSSHPVFLVLVFVNLWFLFVVKNEKEATISTPNAQT
jgi:hypothetical protein